MKTAVEWLEDKLSRCITATDRKIVFRKAKAMEREQHSNTWNHGSYSLLDHGSGEDFEQYYNETYSKQ